MANKIIKAGVILLTALQLIGLPIYANARQITVGKKGNPSQLELKLSNVPKPNFKLSKSKSNAVEEPYLNLEKKSKPHYGSDLLKLAAGFATQFCVHEGGHYLGAKLAGTDINFKGLNDKWDFEGKPSDREKRITYASGFILPILLSEAALDIDKISKNSPYTIGLVSGPFLHNLAHIIHDATGGLDGKNNDFEGMSRVGLKRGITYSIFLGVPAIQIYRMFKNKDFKNRFNLWINPSKKGDGLIAGFNYIF